MAKIILSLMVLIGFIAVSVLSNAIDKSNLSGKILLRRIRSSTLSSSDILMEYFHKKCEKSSGSYKAVEEGLTQYKDCLNNALNAELLSYEIAIAAEEGKIQTVFHKYCQNRSTILECAHNFTVTVEPCLDVEEIADNKIVAIILKNAIDFVCYKDGDYILNFIANNGHECFKDKTDKFDGCINSMVTLRIANEQSLENVPKRSVEQQCNELTTLQSCIAKELETCDNSVPADTINNLFFFLRRDTPCAINMTTNSNP